MGKIKSIIRKRPRRSSLCIAVIIKDERAL